MWIVPLWLSLTPVAEASPHDALLLSFELPFIARDLRRAGVPDDEVRAVIVGGRERHLHADELHGTLKHAHESVIVYGPVDRFDTVVLLQLDRGLRGRDLYLFLDDDYKRRGRGHAYGHDKHDDVLFIGAPGRGPDVIRIGDGRGSPGHGNHGHGNDGHGKGKGK